MEIKEFWKFFWHDGWDVVTVITNTDFLVPLTFVTLEMSLSGQNFFIAYTRNYSNVLLMLIYRNFTFFWLMTFKLFLFNQIIWSIRPFWSNYISYWALIHAKFPRNANHYKKHISKRYVATLHLILYLSLHGNGSEFVTRS